MFRALSSMAGRVSAAARGEAQTRVYHRLIGDAVKEGVVYICVCMLYICVCGTVVVFLHSFSAFCVFNSTPIVLGHEFWVC